MTGADGGSEDGPVDLKAWVSKVDPGGAAAVMDSVLEKASAEGATVLVLNGDLVFGTDHLASALYHARKAIDEGRNASESLQMETLLYSSGERQLGSAIKKMSVDASTTLVAVANLSQGDFRPGEGWEEIPRRPTAVNRDALHRFGIGRAEVETVDADMVTDLVLERVANVDLVKK